MQHDSSNRFPGRVFLIAGEHSGDLHGSLVIRHLKNLSPEIEVEGIGGSMMENAGMHCIHSIDELAVIGFVEVLINLKSLRTVLSDVKKRLRSRRPDILVLIDYPGFNVRVAEYAKELGIHVLYYICPQVWAWHASRAKKIARVIDEAVVVFPFEVDIWKKTGIPVSWFGHPLMGITRPTTSPQVLRRELKPDAGAIISLLPGSRTQEIYYIFPELLDAAEQIFQARPDTRFLLPVAGTINDAKVLPYLKGRNLPITMLRGQTYEAIAASDIALVASGTATLETAIIGTPMIVVYQTNWVTAIISRVLIQSPNIGLPNVLAGREIVPEFIRWNFNSGNIAAETLDILANPHRQRQIRRDLESVRSKLGEPGACQRVAKHIFSRLKELTGR